MRSANRATGDWGEELAARWLAGRGYRILARNLRSGRKEIDLICLHRRQLVFVEVKTGTSFSHGDPVHRVDHQKRRALIAAALRWLARRPVPEGGIRFDVISVLTDHRPPRIEHYPSAFGADSL